VVIGRVDRILGGVFIALAAVILAFGECFYVNLRIGGSPIPLAQIVAIAANLLLPWASYKLTGQRGAALIPAVLWGVIAILFAASGPGGDVVIPGNWQGMFLLLGGAAAAVISIAVLVPTGRVSRIPAARPAARTGGDQADRSADGRVGSRGETKPRSRGASAKRR
jgi:hypothetical protein